MINDVAIKCKFHNIISKVFTILKKASTRVFSEDYEKFANFVDSSTCLLFLSLATRSRRLPAWSSPR